MFSGIDTIVWDWNGTLLDDTELCIATINELLEARKLPLLNKAAYHEAFGFPIVEYYKRIGFDFEKEPFEIPAHEYIEKYSEKVHLASLHEGAIEVLSTLKDLGYRQLILSASEQNKLEAALNIFGIAHYFDEVAGLDNHFAASKTSIGRSLLQKLQIEPKQACLIGDTLHDHEVAGEMGCNCILIAKGHQPEKKLLTSGVTVIQDLNALAHLLKM